jgi:hypothetical protein
MAQSGTATAGPLHLSRLSAVPKPMCHPTRIRCSTFAPLPMIPTTTADLMVHLCLVELRNCQQTVLQYDNRLSIFQNSTLSQRLIDSNRDGDWEMRHSVVSRQHRTF